MAILVGGGGMDAAAVNVRWLSPGVKNVTLTVTRDGCISQFTRTIDLVTLPIADFQVSGLTCFNGGSSAVVTFTGDAGAGGGAATLYNWNFGDASVIAGNPALPITLFWKGTNGR